MNKGIIEVWCAYYPIFLKGAIGTLEYAAIAVIFGTIVGTLIAILHLSKNKVIGAIANVYVTVLRGTPLLVQMYIAYLFLPIAFPALNFITKEQWVVISLILNSSAYVSEIIRGGILSVDPGQMEAARSLGMSAKNCMIKIILPQAVRICLPSLVNQFIITLKDSTILYAIGLSEVMYNAKIYVGRTMESFATYTWVAVFFLLIVTVLSFISRYVERRMNA